MARISNGESHHLWFRGQADTEYPAIRHRMYGVHDEVDHDLAHLVRIGQDHWTRIGQHQLYLDLISRKTFVKHLETVFDHLLQIERNTFRSFASCEGEQLVHHPRNPLNLGNDGLEAFLDRLVRDAIHEIFRAAKNDVHRSPDFVGHTRGHRTKLGDAFGFS